MAKRACKLRVIAEGDRDARSSGHFLRVQPLRSLPGFPVLPARLTSLEATELNSHAADTAAYGENQLVGQFWGNKKISGSYQEVLSACAKNMYLTLFISGRLGF